MTQTNKSKLMIVMLVALLSSCSVSKMRYTNGFNADFLPQKNKTDNATKQSKRDKKDLTTQFALTIENQQLNALPNLNNNVSNIKIDNTTQGILASEHKPIISRIFRNNLYNKSHKAEVKSNNLKETRKTQNNRAVVSNEYGETNVWVIIVGVLVGIAVAVGVYLLTAP